MKTYDADTVARFAKGEIDFFDGLTFIFDSGIANVFVGRGSFDWTDATLGTQTFYGLAGLLSIDVPRQALGNEALPITVRLAETYVPVGSDTPINVFDDGVRQTIDEEPWQGREVILSRFWRNLDGVVLYREQIGRRVIDSMPQEEDEAGLPIRVAVLEREDIIQRDVEGKTANAQLQKLIDPADRSCEHIAVTSRQSISWGALPTNPAPAATGGTARREERQ